MSQVFDNQIQEMIFFFFLCVYISRYIDIRICFSPQYWHWHQPHKSSILCVLKCDVSNIMQKKKKKKMIIKRIEIKL